MRRLIVLLLAITVLAIGAWLMSSRQSEPSYGGRKLSEWLVEYQPDGSEETRNQAGDAIRHIGTNGIPYYLKWVQHEAPSWKIKMYLMIKGIPWIGQHWRASDKNFICADVAPYTFQILGSKAEGAIPELVRIMNNPRGLKSRPASSAAMALALIGEPAVPHFSALLTNPVAYSRAKAAIFLAGLGSKARPAVPALVQALNDDDHQVRVSVEIALREIDPEAFTNSILNIAPEALTNAPPR